MKTRTALLIDRVVGTPLCWVLNLVTYTTGLACRRNHSPPYRVRRILMIKLMGIGSIVQALPLIDGLSERYPDAEVRMLCFPETEIFARRLAPVDGIFVIDNRSLRRLAWTTLVQLVAILRWGPDLAIDLEFRSKFSSLLTTLTCALNRGGFFDVTTHFRGALHTHLVYANPQRHIGELYNHLGRVFGVEVFKPLEKCASRVRVGSGEEQEVARVLEAYGIAAEDRLIVINANAGDLCLERRWPGEKFAIVAARLTARGRVVLVGSPQERDYVESVRARVPESIRADVLNLAGSISFGGFLSLLARASVAITNDSGPMHLAALLGAPVVSLWGPGRPASYEPRTPRHLAVREDVFCSPCLYVTHEPPCGGDNICMKRLGVGAVLDAVGKLVPELSVDSGTSALEPSGEADVLPGLVVRT